jgi:hypothetical protein
MLPALLSLIGTGVSMYGASQEAKEQEAYEKKLEEERKKALEEANRDKYRNALARAIGAEGYALGADYEKPPLEEPDYAKWRKLQQYGQVIGQAPSYLDLAKQSINYTPETPK